MTTGNVLTIRLLNALADMNKLDPMTETVFVLYDDGSCLIKNEAWFGSGYDYDIQKQFNNIPQLINWLRELDPSFLESK